MASYNQRNPLYLTLKLLPQRSNRGIYVGTSAMFSKRHDIEFATIPIPHTRFLVTTSITINLNTQVSAKVKKQSVQYRASYYCVYRLASRMGIWKYLSCLPRGDKPTR